MSKKSKMAKLITSTYESVRPDVIPKGFQTAEAWAIELNMGASTLRHHLRKLTLQGKVDALSLRPPGQRQRILHYREK